MRNPTVKPNVGDTVLVKSDGLTYEGRVTDVLSSQFLYEVMRINNQSNPLGNSSTWHKFCFYTDDWKFKATPIDRVTRR